MAVEKPWGVSQRLYFDGALQIERIRVVAGGYSSIHLHQRKANIFYIHEGGMLVHIYSGKHERIKTHELVVDHTLVVPATVMHQFESHEVCVATEVYLGSPCETDDIVRFSSNGCHSSSPNVVLSHDLTNVALCCGCNARLDAPEQKWELVSWLGATRQMCLDCQRKLLGS